MDFLQKEFNVSTVKNNPNTINISSMVSPHHQTIFSAKPIMEQKRKQPFGQLFERNFLRSQRLQSKFSVEKKPEKQGERGCQERENVPVNRKQVNGLKLSALLSKIDKKKLIENIQTKSAKHNKSHKSIFLCRRKEALHCKLTENKSTLMGN